MASSLRSSAPSPHPTPASSPCDLFSLSHTFYLPTFCHHTLFIILPSKITSKVLSVPQRVLWGLAFSFVLIDLLIQPSAFFGPLLMLSTMPHLWEEVDFPLTYCIIEVIWKLSSSCKMGILPVCLIGLLLGIKDIQIVKMFWVQRNIQIVDSISRIATICWASTR